MTKAQFADYVTKLQAERPTDRLLSAFDFSGPLGHRWPNDAIAKEISEAEAKIGPEAIEDEKYAHLARMVGDKEGGKAPFQNLCAKYYSEICGNLATTREQLTD